MNRKKIIQIIAITFLILAVILLIPNTKWNDSSSIWGFISLILGTTGSIISIFIPTRYTFHFTKQDWAHNIKSNDFSLSIKAQKHGLGNSTQVQTFLKSEIGFEEVGVNSLQDEKGNVIIIANSIFDGKVVVS